MNFACPHRPALEAYARYKGFPHETQADGSVLCTSPSGDVLTATFDALGRLANIASTLKPQNPDTMPGTPTTEKPWWKFGG